MDNLEYTTADLESPIADFKCDVQRLPFETGRFDIVICNHVLEHVDNDRKAMKEILRVLKPGGFAIMFVPIDFSTAYTIEDPSVTDPKERKRLFHQYDHVRLYGKDYPQRLTEEGFEIRAKNYVEELSEDTMKRYCLTSNEMMYAYFKP